MPRVRGGMDKNMKRTRKAIAFFVILTILLGVLPLNAGAIFTDNDDIVYSDAVNMLVALGIINGYTDGSFRPDVGISRAEISKTISLMLNGGNEPESLDGQARVVFFDVLGGWAARYINYVASIGIVSGYGDGNFKPWETITGQQIAKMLLVCLNYDPEIEGLEGSEWSENSDKLAYEVGLYDNVGEDFVSAQVLSRDMAALIIANALNTDRVIYELDSENAVTAYVKEGSNMMDSTFDARVVTGIVVANGYGNITNTAGQTMKNFDASKSTIIDTGLLTGGESELLAFTYSSYGELLGTAVTAVINRSTYVAYGVVDVGISNEYILSKAATKEQAQALLASEGLVLDSPPKCENYVPSGYFYGNIAGCITRFVDYNGDATVDMAMTIAPVVGIYSGDGPDGEKIITFADDVGVPEYDQIQYSDDVFTVGAPVMCTVISGTNYIKACKATIGFIDGVATDMSSVSLDGKQYYSSQLKGAVFFETTTKILSGMVRLYMDDCGYVLYSDTFD